MDFQVCAHRGASGTHPENTVCAFRAAVELGVERIEFDVRRTIDGELVIMHDPTVDRTTDGSGPVWELTGCLVRSLDAGSHRAPEFAGERIPTFAEALAACPVLVNVHVYPGPDDLAAIVDEVIATLRRLDRLDSAFIAGSTAVIERVAAVEPRLERCCLDHTARADYPERCAALGCRILQPGHAAVTADLCDRAHRLGQTVHPFYADQPDAMRALLACGVDGLLTNQPALLLEVLGRR